VQHVPDRAEVPADAEDAAVRVCRLRCPGPAVADGPTAAFLPAVRRFDGSPPSRSGAGPLKLGRSPSRSGDGSADAPEVAVSLRTSLSGVTEQADRPMGKLDKWKGILDEQSAKLEHAYPVRAPAETSPLTNLSVFTTESGAVSGRWCPTPAPLRGEGCWDGADAGRVYGTTFAGLE
jgi:hypothetical protein